MSTRIPPGMLALLGMAAALPSPFVEDPRPERFRPPEPPRALTPEEIAEAEAQRRAALEELDRREEAERVAAEEREHQRLMEGSRKYAKAQDKRERRRQQRLARGGR